jgi:hypothetical protein
MYMRLWRIGRHVFALGERAACEREQQDCLNDAPHATTTSRNMPASMW